MQFLDKHGWPVERIKGRRITNLIRLLIHTRKIRRGKWRYPAVLTPPAEKWCSLNMGIPEEILKRGPEKVTAREQEILRGKKNGGGSRSV